MASGDTGGFPCTYHRNSCGSTAEGFKMCTPENALLDFENALLDFEFCNSHCKVMQMPGLHNYVLHRSAAAAVNVNINYIFLCFIILKKD